MAPDADHGELVVLAAEQPVGGAAHHKQIFRMSAQAAERAEHALNEQRSAREALVDEIGEIVEMADVAADVFEAHVAGASELRQNLTDIGEGIADDGGFRSLDISLLPRVLPLRDAEARPVEGEVHHAHVERTELGLDAQGKGEALVERSAGAGVDVEDRVRLGGDERRKRAQSVRLRGRPALRVAGVKTQHRGARPRCLDRLLGDGVA